jgi:type I restriction enzyme, S subunit
MQQKSELPEGWVITNISKVGEIVTGNTPPKKDPTNFGNKYPWVKPGDLNKNIPITKTEEYLSEKGSSLARLLPINAVLVSCIGILGKVGIAGTQLATNQQINSISFEEEIVYPKYGYYYCKTLNKWLEDNSSATTIQIINKTRFSEAPFYLPPLAEQYRIVSAIEALFARLDATDEKLDRVLEILKKFRQSVHAAAFNGQLTENWRVALQNLKVENENIEININSNTVCLIENPTILCSEILPALPNNWCWSTIEQLGDFLLFSGLHIFVSTMQNNKILIILK